jgi:hypothetical protein
MTNTTDRRLENLERALEVPPLKTPVWISWLTFDELDWLEGLLYADEIGERELSEADMQRASAVVDGAIRRMEAGEPPT